MTTKLLASVFALSLPLIGLIFSREGFPHRQKVPAIAEDDLFSKLSIERFDKKTAAPDFALQDLHGATVQLQDFTGKVVFLNFWATWCPSCKLEMPAMEELHKEFGSQGFVILAVNYREGPEKIKTFYKEHGLTFPALLDTKGKVFDLYREWSLPTTLLINKNGKIVGKVVGYRDWHSDEARALLRQLLDGNT